MAGERRETAQGKSDAASCHERVADNTVNPTREKKEGREQVGGMMDGELE